MPRHGLGFARSSVTFTVTFDGIDRAISTRRDMMIVVAVRSEEARAKKAKCIETRLSRLVAVQQKP
jgi:hypothetical protein